jgi:glycosyltransferase involved in cell wall biosynthesis
MQSPYASPEQLTKRSSRKLLVVGHFVRAGRVGGAEHMLYNLLQGFQQKDVDVGLLCSRKTDLSELFISKIRPGGRLRLLELGGAGSRFVAEQRACLHHDLSSDAILFPNYYLPVVIPSRLGRVATVIHDFQYRHFPQYFSAKKRVWLRAAQTLSLHKADRVIVISEFVRRDAIRWFGDHLAEKLVVIPNPVSWDRFVAGEQQPRPIVAPYVLAVAAHYPHKNLETLIRAFSKIIWLHPDMYLVLVGQSYNELHGVASLSGSIGPLIEQLNLTNRVQLTGYVNDLSLAQWYRHAELFAFPSLFEGFGMPAVEALGFGLPTLTTRLTALPETTLGLATMVDDALDDGEWAEKMLGMLEQPAEYRPSAPDVARIRELYAPERIASMYLTTLFDNQV